MVSVPRSAFIALVAVLGLALVAAGADGRAPRSCAKPKPQFRDGSIRIQTTMGRLGNQQWYICSATLRRPRIFYDGSEGVATTEAHFRRFGNRVAYWWIWDTGGGGGWELGWVHARTARARDTAVDFDDALDSEGIAAAAVATNGAMAYLECVDTGSGTSAQRVGYAPPGARGRLGRPRTLVDVPAGNIDPRSLTTTRSVVSWTTTSGEPGSARIPSAR